MKVLVCIKRVVDFSVRVQLKRDGSGVELAGVKMGINPFDEIAIEEALRLREKGLVKEVVVCTIAGAEAQAQLRTALAMGADRAVQIDPAGLLSNGDVQPLYAARLLRALVAREQPALVLLGKQAIDDDCNQTGQMLAALWDRPQVTFVSKLELAGATLRGTREVDAGLETLEVDLPAVVTTDLRLNEPRFVKMPDIMKAKSKPLEVLPAATLGVAAPPALATIAHATPPRRAGGRKVADIAELVQALKDRGVLQ
jgi:electron transfer flavoprotein beta subunit